MAGRGAGRDARLPLQRGRARSKPSFGADIEDRIRLTARARRDAAEARTVRVEMFSQARRRAAGPFEDVTGNPVVVLFLEHHVETLAKVLKANPRYLKNAIRAGLRDRAVVDGRRTSTIDGPRGARLAGRDEALRRRRRTRRKMRGLDSLDLYLRCVADEVPGRQSSRIEARATTRRQPDLFSKRR